jgi:hypothetical protein
VCENRKFVELNFPHFPTFLPRDTALKNDSGRRRRRRRRRRALRAYVPRGLSAFRRI